MVSLRRARRGASTLGCLVSLALFLAAVYYGVHIGGVYWRYYQLLDDMRQQATCATVHRRRHPGPPARPGRLPAGPDAPSSGSSAAGDRAASPSTRVHETVDLPLLQAHLRAASPGRGAALAWTWPGSFWQSAAWPSECGWSHVPFGAVRRAGRDGRIGRQGADGGGRCGVASAAVGFALCSPMAFSTRSPRPRRALEAARARVSADRRPQ